MDMMQMFYEITFGFIGLFLFTKILGKTQISQLTAFDFIAALILGELVGNAIFDESIGILHIAYVLFLWGALLYLVEYIAIKFKASRYWIEGKPAIVIYEGKFVYDEMKKNKVDIQEVQQLLRMKDIFSVQEVEYAILEENGDLSVLKKAAFQTPTVADLQVKQQKPELAMTLITDGEIIEDNLAEAGLTQDWLEKEISEQFHDSVEEIFYAEWMGERLYILPYFKIKQKDYHKKMQKK